MIRPLLTAVLFLSSYIPLFMILAVQYWRVLDWLVITVVILSGLGVLGLAVLAYLIGSTQGMDIQPTGVKRRDEAVLAYIVTYLLPFLDLQFAAPRDTVVAVILLLTVGLLYVNSRMIHVNPTLAILGIHIYEIETSSGQTHTIISKSNKLVPRETIRATELAPRIHWGSVDHDR